jgi:hypothetical protein
MDLHEVQCQKQGQHRQKAPYLQEMRLEKAAPEKKAQKDLKAGFCPEKG